MRRSQGTFITVQDTEILEAMRTLGNLASVFAEPADAAAWRGSRGQEKRG
ncbi:MAG: hypothetical protein AB1497_07495 [Bacillota bacterium]